MIINDVRPQMETSAQLEEQFFSIQDQGMIFDILRNKMYSNPILAICREISCNARDAHREVGKSDIPIVIYLPNHQEPFFKVKDYGPGISPDRMSNIFIKYTASTKRSDNIQTGGFGLGAKTPFSYSDSFNIVTHHNGTRYNYACFIDETKIGKLSLLSSVPSDEPNGTEIIVPVQSKDFNLFQDYVEQSTRHWKVKPTIKPFNVTWRDPIPMMSGNDWCLANSNSWSRYTKLIVDEVEYPVDSNALRSYAETAVIDAARGDLYLYFGVGELSLSASREQIYLDEPTKKSISEKIKNVTQEIKSFTQAKLNGASNFFEANLYYRSALQKNFSNLGFLGQLNWQGHDLISGHPDINCTLISFSKGKSYSRRHTIKETSPDKISRSTHRSFIFSGEENTNQIYINDLGITELTNRHVKKAFENNPNLKCVQVICPNDKVTVEVLNTTYSLHKMNPQLLSSIAKASTRTQRSANSRLIVSKFDLTASGFKQTSYASIDEDYKSKVLVLLNKDSLGNKEVCLKSGKNFGMQYLRNITTDNSNYSFYGIDSTISKERIDEDFSDFIDLENFIDDKILTHERDEYILARHYYQSQNSVNKYLVYNKKDFMTQIDNSNSTFLNHIMISDRIHNLTLSQLKYFSLYEDFSGEITDEEVSDWLNNHPEFDIKKSEIELESKYPLLSYLFDYYNSDTISPEHISQYINLVDASLM